MKHRLVFEFTPDEINVLQVALDHLAEHLYELKRDDKILAGDWRIANCAALIDRFHVAMESVTETAVEK